MRRKSSRSSSKAVPETKSDARKATRNSRRKRSPSQDSENDDMKSPKIEKNTTDSADNEQKEVTSKISVVIKQNVAKDSENVNNDFSDGNEGHTPPHTGSSGNEAPITDEVDSGKGKSKGLNNSQVEENSEIKMNSVTSVSSEDATTNNDVNPEVNVPHIMSSNDNSVVDNIDTKISEEEQSTDEIKVDQLEENDQEKSTLHCEKNSNVDHESESFENSVTENSIVNQVVESERNSETNVEGEKTNGENVEQKEAEVDDDQAEEGEIRESKSDEENDNNYENHHSAAAKVKKPSIKIKLRRDSFFEVLEQSNSTEAAPEPKRIKWDPDEHKCLRLSFKDVFKLDVSDFKALSSDLKLADEKEIKLEDIYQQKVNDLKNIKERVKSFDTSAEEIEKPEYVKQSSTISSDDQENTNIIALNRKISIVDDTASKLRPPPSPAKQPVSSVLFISNLVRPFTIKQLKELLQRTGNIKEEGFWTDRIKSKCYVQYETIDEAEATRNALHGVNWPIGNGKKLVIEYASEDDIDKAKNPPPQAVAPAPVITSPRAKTPQKENTNPVPDIRNGNRREERKRKDSERDRERSKGGLKREWDMGKEATKERIRSRSRERRRKHSGRRSITPLEDFIARKQRKLEESVPQKLMDDLFQRTKTMPCIYWQPLSPDEISIKQQQRLSRMEEHKRRLEENSRNRGAREPGRGAYRRRYD